MGNFQDKVGHKGGEIDKQVPRIILVGGRKSSLRMRNRRECS